MKRKRNTKELEELPKSLVKFCNAETALSILNEGSLRWRTPHNLGDPFGYDQHSLLNFDCITLVEAVIQTATAMIFSSNVPVGHSPMLDAIRRWRDEDRFASREEAQGVLKGLCSKMVQQRFVEINQIQDDWQKFAGKLMVSSFNENHDNPRLWQSYGDNHSGAAIRFKTSDYTALSEPYRIKYQKERPSITNLKDQVDYIISRSPSTPQDHFLELFITRSKLYRDERELRCFKKHEGEGDFDDIPFEKDDVEAIYLGVMISDEFKEQIIEIAKEQYPGVRIYFAKPTDDRFELVF